jgi:hypothetical protein
MKMNRMLALMIAWSALALGVAHAVPARPLYEPPAFPKAPVRVGIDLNGTAWLGKYNAVNRIFVFEADGTLSYKATTAKGKLFKNRGTWKLDGANLSFEHNTGAKTVMQFQGIVKDANTIVGAATYTLTNKKAEQSLQRTTP